MVNNDGYPVIPVVKWWLSHWLNDRYPIGYNNVLLVQIEGPLWYTIYHHLPVVKGVHKSFY